MPIVCILIVLQYISIVHANHTLLYSRTVEVNIVAVGKCNLQYVISYGTQYTISYDSVNV